MSQEHPRPPYRRSAEVFGLTEKEAMFYQVSDKRFQELLSDPQTDIIEVKVDENTYGSFLFVTLSKQGSGPPAYLTFYGLGYHEQREQWHITTWVWYEAQRFHKGTGIPLEKEEGIALIQERRDEIAGDITDDAPSQRAQLFALLADLTDEDGALAELDDLESLGWFDQDQLL